MLQGAKTPTSSSHCYPPIVVLLVQNGNYASAGTVVSPGSQQVLSAVTTDPALIRSVGRYVDLLALTSTVIDDISRLAAFQPRTGGE